MKTPCSLLTVLFTTVLLTVCLTACSSGSSSASKSNSNTERSSVTGAGVKGPLAHARVRLYRVEYTADDLRGELLDEGVTGANAAIEGLAVPVGLSGRVILEFIAEDDTVEINTGSAPIFDRLFTVVDVQRIYDDEAIYASPLTSMAFDLAKNNADESTPFSGNGDGTITEEEFTAALDMARRLVTRSLGFGMPDSVDIFTVPPLVTETTVSVDALAEVAIYRQAIEVVAALTVILSEDTTAADTPQDLLNALIADLGDGSIDGNDRDGLVAAFATLPEVIEAQLNSIEVETLEVPGTSDTIADIERILAEETSVSGVTIDTQVLEDGSIDLDPGEAEANPDLAETEEESEAVDTDMDGIRDDIDSDDDNDGVNDSVDAFPTDAMESSDTDGDGVGDNSDPEPYPEVTFTTSAEIFVAVGEQQTNAAQATPSQSFVYESSDNGVAMVNSNGQVTGVSDGSAIISAYIAGTPAELTTVSYTANVYTPCASCNTYRRIIDEAEVDESIDMLEQPDGKIIVLSRTYTKTVTGEALLLTRLNPDGSLDSSFGTLGHMSYNYTGIGLDPNYFVRGMMIQSSGKILVLGDDSSGRTTVVSRFNTDGSLDTSFGTSGHYLYNDGTYWSSEDISLDASDNIVIGMNYLFPDTSVSPTVYIPQSLFVRLSADGVPDTSFDGDGVLLVSEFYAYDVELLDNGKLLAAGTDESFSNDNISVTRFNVDGTLDTGFGIGGRAQRNIGTAESVTQMLVLDDGDIVVIGFVYQGGRGHGVLLRMTDTGAWYVNYNGNGQVLLDFDNGANSSAYGVLAQDDGKVVVVGRFDKGIIALARVNDDGSLDSSIPSIDSSADGIVTYDLDYEDSLANAVAVLRRANGGYLMLAYAFTEQTYWDHFGVQYLSDSYLIGLDEKGALDNSSFIATGLANEAVTDFDGDGFRDRIDLDDDQDGVWDVDDAMPYDTDNDGVDNDLDLDDDGDGINDADDTYPFDLDNDGLLNDNDLDDDGDGTDDVEDAFPYDASEQFDTDEDGVGNNADSTPYPTLTYALSGNQTIGLSATLDNPATASAGSEDIQYTSSDTGVATVDASGTVTPVATGTVTISADLTDWPDTPVTYQLTVDNSCGTCTSSTVEIDAGDLEYTSGVIELGDGDLLVLGYIENANITSVITRLKANGTAESSFNSGAVLSFTYTTGSDTKVIDAVEQSDGKILLLSEYTSSTTQFLVTRLNTDGSIDTSYGTSGHFLLYDTVDDFIPGAMTLLSDNRLIVAGTYQSGATSEAVVIRLSTGGAMDAGFGFMGLGIGTVTTDGMLHDVTLDGDKIVVVGTDGAGTTALMARLTSAGELDTTFNSSGLASIDFASETSTNNRILVQSTGQYLISGALDGGEIYLSRYNTDGTLDTTFGSAGISREGVSSAPFSGINESYALIETADAYLMLVGGAEISASSGILDSLALWRFDASGVIDNVVTQQFGFISPYLAGVAIINSNVGGMVIAVDNYRPGPSEAGELMLYSVNDDGSEKTDRFE